METPIAPDIDEDVNITHTEEVSNIAEIIEKPNNVVTSTSEIENPIIKPADETCKSTLETVANKCTNEFKIEFSEIECESDDDTIQMSSFVSDYSTDNISLSVCKNAETGNVFELSNIIETFQAMNINATLTDVTNIGDLTFDSTNFPNSKTISEEFNAADSSSGLVLENNEIVDFDEIISQKYSININEITSAANTQQINESAEINNQEELSPPNNLGSELSTENENSYVECAEIISEAKNQVLNISKSVKTTETVFETTHDQSVQDAFVVDDLENVDPTIAPSTPKMTPKKRKALVEIPDNTVGNICDQTFEKIILSPKNNKSTREIINNVIGKLEESLSPKFKSSGDVPIIEKPNSTNVSAAEEHHAIEQIKFSQEDQNILSPKNNKSIREIINNVIDKLEESLSTKFKSASDVPIIEKQNSTDVSVAEEHHHAIAKITVANDIHYSINSDNVAALTTSEIVPHITEIVDCKESEVVADDYKTQTIENDTTEIPKDENCSVDRVNYFDSIKSIETVVERGQEISNIYVIRETDITTSDENPGHVNASSTNKKCISDEITSKFTHNSPLNVENTKTAALDNISQINDVEMNESSNTTLAFELCTEENTAGKIIEVTAVAEIHSTEKPIETQISTVSKETECPSKVRIYQNPAENVLQGTEQLSSIIFDSPEIPEKILKGPKGEIASKITLEVTTVTEIPSAADILEVIDSASTVAPLGHVHILSTKKELISNEINSTSEFTSNSSLNVENTAISVIDKISETSDAEMEQSSSMTTFASEPRILTVEENTASKIISEVTEVTEISSVQKLNETQNVSTVSKEMECSSEVKISEIHHENEIQSTGHSSNTIIDAFEITENILTEPESNKTAEETVVAEISSAADILEINEFACLNNCTTTPEKPIMKQNISPVGREFQDPSEMTSQKNTVKGEMQSIGHSSSTVNEPLEIIENALKEPESKITDTPCSSASHQRVETSKVNTTEGNESFGSDDEFLRGKYNSPLKSSHISYESLGLGFDELMQASPSVLVTKMPEFQYFSHLKLKINSLQQQISQLRLESNRKEGVILNLKEENDKIRALYEEQLVSGGENKSVALDISQAKKKIVSLILDHRRTEEKYEMELNKLRQQLKNKQDTNTENTALKKQVKENVQLANHLKLAEEENEKLRLILKQNEQILDRFRQKLNKASAQNAQLTENLEVCKESYEKCLSVILEWEKKGKK